MDVRTGMAMGRMDIYEVHDLELGATWFSFPTLDEYGLGLGWSFLLTTSFYFAFAFCLLSSTLLTPVREEGTEHEVVPLSFSSYQDSDWSVYPDHPQNATTFFFLSTVLILVCLLLFHYLFDYVV